MTTINYELAGAPRSEGVPLYVRLAMSLRTRIFQGEWKVGDRLPPFEDLAERYGVALNTVRKAVQLMAAESLVSTARGLGTRVVATSAPVAHPNVRTTINDPLVVSPEVSINVLANEEVASLPPELIEGYELAERYRRVFKTHGFRGTPFALLDIFVDSDVYARFPREAERSQKLSLLLRDHGGVRIASSREELTVSHADQQASALLHYPTAAPLVRLRRWRMGHGGAVVYACVALYRSDMFVWDISKSEPKADHFGAHIIPDLRPI